MPLKILAFNFIFSVDTMDNNEMIIVENQSWIFVHYYVVVGWKRMPILFSFECCEGGITINIRIMIIVVFITYGGLIDEQIVKCLVCLGANGVSTFQGVRFGVSILLST